MKWFDVREQLPTQIIYADGSTNSVWTFTPSLQEDDSYPGSAYSVSNTHWLCKQDSEIYWRPIYKHPKEKTPSRAIVVRNNSVPVFYTEKMKLNKPYSFYYSEKTISVVRDYKNHVVVSVELEIEYEIE